MTADRVIDLTDLVTELAYVGAEEQARAWRQRAHAIEIDGRIAQRIRRQHVDALVLIKHERDPWRCDHLAVPAMAFVRAPRPGRLMCGPCATVESNRYDPPLPASLPCDGCGSTDGATREAVIGCSFLTILAATCWPCGLSDLADEIMRGYE